MSRGDEKGARKRSMRTAARFYAVQALFQMEKTGQTLDHVRAEFEAFRIGVADDEGQWVDADRALFRRILELVVDNQAMIDQLTDRALVAKWPLVRIDPTLRALFRAAGAELALTDTPPRVVITEYLRIAQDFFPEGKESAFVNAVLDHMARVARPEAFAH